MSLYLGKGKKIPFNLLMDLVTYTHASGKICKAQDVFHETTAGKHVAAVAEINNSLRMGSWVTPEVGVPGSRTG